MPKSRSTAPFQYIDGDANEVGNMEEWIFANGLNCSGLDYDVVAIMGSQSSGKSTLLNELYKTEFKMMNAQTGHKRTTDGIWMSYALDGNGGHSVVMDVEGTDSKERREDGLTFERRATLFTLAVANALIINVWYTNLGNCIGSNHALLQAVIEANLELFHNVPNSTKIMLIFVVRDWSEDFTPLDVLKKEIQQHYVEEIWEEVKKPESLKDAKMTDFFNIHTFGLPHMLYERKKFDENVRSLRQLLEVSRKTHSYSNHIPADGFGAYCRNVWATILEQTHLNIPSLKEMVSSFRCQEIKQKVSSEILPKIAAESQEFLASENEQFSSWAEMLLQTAVENYRESAGRYKLEIVQSIEEELIDIVFLELQKIADAQFSHINERLIQNFAEKLKGKIVQESALDDSLEKIEESMEEMLDIWKQYPNMCFELEENIVEEFDGIASDLSLVLSGIRYAFYAKAAKNSLLSSLEKQSNSIREEQLSLLGRALKEQIRRELKPLHEALGKKGMTASIFWEVAAENAGCISNKCYNLYASPWKGLTDPRKIVESTEFEKCMAIETTRQLANEMKIWSKDAATLFKKRFDNVACENGSILELCKTMPEDALTKLFEDARTDASCVLQILTEVSFDLGKAFPSVDPSLLPVLEATLTEEEVKDVEDTSRKEVENWLQLARDLRRSAASILQNIPLWGWIVILFISWKVLMAVVNAISSYWVLVLLALFAISFLQSGFQKLLPIDVPSIRSVESLYWVLLRAFGFFKSALDKFQDPRAQPQTQRAY